LFAQLRLEFSALALERGLTLRVAPCTLAIRSDPHLLRRVLQNLLSNAIRYTPTGRILLGCRRREGELRIEVWDSGIGIAEDRKAEVFEEFRQLHPRQGADKGAGLGLAIVDRISRLLGHPIEVLSRLGHGTCFSVTVPRAKGSGAALPDDEAVAPVPAMPTGLAVLCVDNDTSILQGLAALLERWGHRAILAADAKSALAAAGSNHPDVVLLDYHLDGARTGLDVLVELRRHWSEALPALVITADRSEAVRCETRAHGCDILHKPVKPAALRRFLNGAALRKGADPDKDDAA
jgi:CheY-like chemotaxis protein